MSPLELLNAYLKRLESRFRLAALARGAAVVAAAALVTTVVVVLATDWLAFSERSLMGGRIALFLSVAFAIGFGLAVPLLSLDRRKTARATEQKIPEFNQRLLTLAEREKQGEREPFLELLAADTLELAQAVEPRRVVGSSLLIGFFSAAAAALGVLLWLTLGASGFLGYGARLLWAGPPRGEIQPFYDIVINPGNKTVRRGANLAVTARLVGFEAPMVRLYAKYRDSAKWEEAPMAPQEGGLGYEFLFAGIPQTVDYYASAGKLRSKTFTLSVIDVPRVKRVRVTYHFPPWTGLGTAVEDPGGDLRAVEGTEAEVAVETDRPLSNGQLVLEDGGQVTLSGGAGNWRTGRVKIEKDGAYHIAALEQSDLVRLTDDYFIEVRKDTAPQVRFVRPGRDARVTPIEEVTLAVEAGDDFGLHDLSLHYSVNGDAEKTVPLLKQKGALQSDGSTVVYLEDYKLVPGDVVSVYATARDARIAVKTDMFFIEAQPYEREYTQSQQMGGEAGMEGMEGGQRQDRISQRQKEIIAATWNQLRDSSANRQAAAENARFLSETQSKLRDQAKSMATRMGRRELSTENQEFQSFSKDMDQAAEDMGAAAEKLKSLKWQDALAPEQKALQHILRAEATFRQIQVAFGNRGSRGGGQGGGSSGRDLENMFDLELDTEKNQYETGQQASASSGNQRSREIDEAMQRLEQLARRQQELADRARQSQQSFQQRWQQEMLRREAEELQRRMEQLARGNSSSRGAQGQGQSDARLDQALQRLSEATNDMRRASSSQSGGSQQQQGQPDSRRAAERLREAQNLMRGMRGDQSGQQVEDLARRAEQLAKEQQEFQNQLRQLFGNQTAPDGRAQTFGATREQIDKARQMAGQRDKMAEELARIEREMQQTARDLASSQRAASSKVRSALGNMQQNEIGTRMRYNSGLLRQGYGPYVVPREQPITQGLNELRDQLREAQGTLGRNPAGQNSSEQALAQLEQMRNRLQGLTQRGSRQPGAQQQGQRGQEGQGGARGSEGQRGGQMGQGGRDGQMGQGGRDGQTGGGRRQGWLDTWERSAMNRGDWRLAPGTARPVSGADAERVYRESLRDLTQLRQSIENNPEAARDIQELIQEMMRLDPSRFPGNPELIERLRTQVLPSLEQIELQLRRQLDEQQGSQVRNAGSEPVPPGYTEAVADYFRRLSKGK